jgi:hypothetical protein
VRRFLLAIAMLVSAGAIARAQSEPQPGPAAPEPGPPPPSGSGPGGDVATGPQRAGFVIELDGGVGYTYLTDKDGVRVDLALGGVGANGIDLGIGVFATPDLALLVRMTAETFFQSLQTTNHIAAHSMFGPAVEWWIDDTVFVGAGLGLGIEGGQDQDGNKAESAVGYGFTARGGFAFSQNEESAWRVSVEGDAGFLIGGRRAYTAALLIGWQSF